jgi:hypothetical protein
MTTQNNILRSIVLIVIIVLLLTYTKNKDEDKKEDWVNYIRAPYNEIESGTDPLQYYRRDRYRKPYRYPFKFYQSYPVPHMRYGN